MNVVTKLLARKGNYYLNPSLIHRAVEVTTAPSLS